jgi:hypothetical protein
MEAIEKILEFTIEKIIELTKADSIEAIDRAMMEAHTAINDVHLQKLKDMERDIAHRLGTEGRGYGSSPMSPQTEEIPRLRRPIRDDPQA